MNEALPEFLRRALKPPYVVLLASLLIFLSTAGTINRLERQAAPAITELKGSAMEGYGIEAFLHEYLADPFGKAIGLSEQQLSLCSQVAALVPAYESSVKWRSTALLTGFFALLFLAYQKYGLGWAASVAGWKRRLNLAATQLILRRWMASLAGRFPRNAQNSAPIKKAVVHAIVPCPACHQELRVPSGKGRIRITCSACGHKFEATT